MLSSWNYDYGDHDDGNADADADMMDNSHDDDGICGDDAWWWLWFLS